MRSAQQIMLDNKTAIASIDLLTPSSRKFYENSRMKMLWSLVFFGASLMFLGFCAAAGGRAQSFRTTRNFNDKFNLSDDAVYSVQVNGMAFATFCHFTAFCLALAASIIISPYAHGTRKEASMLYRPKEFEFGDGN